ncbi:MAG: universal stress protein, partial [Actinobacteria bacterium]|nr:universal stress protein [Actinomycetota bacterium]
MISSTAEAPVVVGVDESGSALDALDWAAAEAATRHRPLRVVHAFTWPAIVDPYGAIPGPGDCGCRAAAEQVLEEAVTRARSVIPDGHITPRLVVGAAARAMLEQALDADLVVLGNRGFGRLRGLLSRSVGVQVVAHATCPIAIVHPFHIVPPGPSAARVVVGIDGSTQSIDAIGYAFHAATQRGIGLTAVHAWTPQ